MRSWLVFVFDLDDMTCASSSLLHVVQVGRVCARPREHAAVEALQHMLTDRYCG